MAFRERDRPNNKYSGKVHCRLYPFLLNTNDDAFSELYVERSKIRHFCHVGEVSLKNKRRDDIIDNIFRRLFEIVQMSSIDNCSVHITCMTQQPHSDVYIVKIQIY